MKRVKLLRRTEAVDKDKHTLLIYSRGEITKTQAMKAICEHNNLDDIPEEYFDYLVKALGYLEAKA